MIAKRYKFVISTLKKAGFFLLKAAEENIEVSSKNNDPKNKVTNVDIAVSNYISGLIRRSFPNEVIYSEENADVNAPADSFWSIDPIDGTANFSRRIPHFAIVISYIEKGIPKVGGIYNPVTQELFSFQKDEGAFFNNEPVSVSDITELSRSHFILHIGRDRRLWDWGLNAYRFLLSHANKTINLGSSALDMCFVGAGRVEACIYGTLTTIDISAAIGFVREAGGLVVDQGGKNLTQLSKKRQVVVAVNNAEILTALKGIVLT